MVGPFVFFFFNKIRDLLSSRLPTCRGSHLILPNFDNQIDYQATQEELLNIVFLWTAIVQDWYPACYRVTFPLEHLLKVLY